ncbi:atypical/PIKK/FRAP protein kinase [Phakopsora pachyrhizi]|nr:atypical/PIKK/FRAP protein kinase [Phakopsora pachyrhizi]
MDRSVAPRPIEVILVDLKSRSDDIRTRAAHEVQQFVLTTSRGVTGDSFTKVYNEVSGRIQIAVSSNDMNEKLGALQAMEKLIDIMDDNSRAFKLVSFVQKVLPCQDSLVMAYAAKIFARLCSKGGNSMLDNVRKQLIRVIEWLQGERKEERRHAAALLLRELVRVPPTSVIYDALPDLLDNIWTAMRDPKVVIREVASDALAGLLCFTASRESTTRDECFSMVLQQAQKGFKLGTSDAIHGSLLGIKELILEGGTFMRPRFQEISDQILSYKDHREALVRRAVVELIPTLASYNSTEFSVTYLYQCMMYLIEQLRKDRDRTTSFYAIGHVASAVKQQMSLYLEAILASVKEALVNRGKKNSPSEASIFHCISMCASAVGQAMTKHMHELLELMFGNGLSEPLRAALVDLVRHIPPLLPVIQEKLLDLLAVTLSGEKFRPPGMPINWRSAPTNTDLSAMEPDRATVTLALKTLGTFNFKGHKLSEFVRDVVIRYADDESPEIRQAAALCCAQVLSRDPIIVQTSAHSIKLISDVLTKLLSVVIADPVPSIRQSTLLSLDPKFDRFLAQPNNIRQLFIALNDEVHAIRESAIKTLGRLAKRNPAYIVPYLRKTLIQLLTDLEYSSDIRRKEESSNLLAHLVSFSKSLTKPYVAPMLKVLLPKARDPHPSVASSIMTALGELARVGGSEVQGQRAIIMQLIMDTLKDLSSSGKRQAALRTLGQLCSNTGYVVDPYFDQPTLLHIITSILKTESSSHVRREALRVLGILGALDPYRNNLAIEQIGGSSIGIGASTDSTPILTDPSHPDQIGSSSEYYYPTVAFSALLSILRDSSLAHHHAAVVQAIIYIFRSLRLKCVGFLPKVVPAILNAMRLCNVALQEYFFQQLDSLIQVVKHHIRNHLSDIITLIHDFWNLNNSSASSLATAAAGGNTSGSIVTVTRPSGSTLLTVIVDLIESIAIALDSEFRSHLPSFLPLLIDSFDYSKKKYQTLNHILKAFQTFGNNLEDYIQLVLPCLTKTIEKPDLPLSLRKNAIITLNVLSKKINMIDQVSRVIHPLIRIINVGNNELRSLALDAISSIMIQIGPDFVIFLSTINNAMIQARFTHPLYESLVLKLLKGESLPDPSFNEPKTIETIESDVAADAGVNKFQVNQQNLKSAWETSTVKKPKAEDWKEWIKRLSVQLLQSSPSHSLRACANLSNVYHPLAKELFNAAFVSCWTELFDRYQLELVAAIQTALSSPTIPLEITHTLLNLAEFMEHDEKVLPIRIGTLGMYAQKCHAFAKALHYKEIEAFTEPTADTLDSLILINQHLQQPDSAQGVLTMAQQRFGMEIREEWFEELERWEDALNSYSRKLEEDPKSIESVLGGMRCLHALGEWESLSDMAQEHWEGSSNEVKRTMAPLAAAAAWGLGQWDSMDSYINVLKSDSAEKAWFKSILSIHRGQHSVAQRLINKARDTLDTELSTLLGESYSRAYNLVVRVQMLSELEEIIVYKESKDDDPSKQEQIQRTWMKRLKGCQRDVEVWQRILKVRALVLSPREDVGMWIKFAGLCRKSGRLGLAEKTLNSLINEDKKNGNESRGSPLVIYSHIKYMWGSGERQDSLAYLKEFTLKLSEEVFDNNQNLTQNNTQDLEQQSRKLEHQRLLSRCHQKLGEWQSQLQEDWSSPAVVDILESYRLSTELDPEWYKAWHAWALVNSKVATNYERNQDAATVPIEIVQYHLVPAVQAFFKSIALSPGNALQDILRLLGIWFKFGDHQVVANAIQDGFGNVSIDTWLEVVPQLIARIHAPSPNVRRLIHNILCEVGKAHPQALVYPLVVASKYPNEPRRRAAIDIITKMKMHSALLIEQALLVSSELVRAAILWPEMWYEGLEEASRLFYGDHNIDAMFATLEPLHDLLEKGPETIRESHFASTYGHDLMEARACCRRYRERGDVSDLNQAWDLYYQVFRSIAKSLTLTHMLDMQTVSPPLLEARDLEIAVPGNGKPVITISHIAPICKIMGSKQRPRELSIIGSEGRCYRFLLKGHEDLRQDERVMQLFGLINTLLYKDPETFKRHLNIRRYAVIPLAPNSGLLAWIENTDTLHVLIKNYRESRKILLNIEARLMQQMAIDHERLCLTQKVEVFEYAMDNTTGQDLYRVLWLKSRNSEAWLDRRINYSRSLAVMSMVGHVLGLGDRHPSNLLLDRVTGMIIHVDFGDCFEVAMTREKWPEKIPFRLTRMLVQAMEISGVEGTFRITSENTMRVMRSNKESIMAVLEAFVHDPLINWRLVKGGRQLDEREGGANTDAGPRMRRPREVETNLYDTAQAEVLNDKALTVVNRVEQKLTGRDFKPTEELSVADQVNKLVQKAVSAENLAQCFTGWCPFWVCLIFQLPFLFFHFHCLFFFFFSFFFAK